MRTAPLAGIGVVLVSLLAACSAPETPDPVATTSAVSLPPETATTAPPGATAREWADAMAPAGDDLVDVLDSWDDATCSSGAMAQQDVTCGAILTTLGFTLETAQLIVDGAMNPSGPKYLGIAPPEVSDLLLETKTAADLAVWAQQTAAESCDAGTDSCQGDVFSALKTAGELDDIFDRWDRVQ